MTLQCGNLRPDEAAFIWKEGGRKVTLFTCCSRAALVGGINCTLFFENSFFRALSMSVVVLVRSYKRMTNLSMQCRMSSGMVLRAEATFGSASVNSGSTAEMAEAVLLPCPAKLDTVSHLVRA